MRLSPMLVSIPMVYDVLTNRAVEIRDADTLGA